MPNQPATMQNGLRLVTLLCASLQGSHFSKGMRMKLASKPVHVIALGLLVMTAAATSSPVWAQRILADIGARNQINIGYREDAAPFSYKAPDGKATGYMLGVCGWVVERVEQQLGKKLRINFTPIPVDQVVRRVQSGGVQLMCSATSDTAERREQIAFSHPLFVESMKLAVRTADRIENAEQLRGKSVVVIGRTTAETFITEQSAKAGWTVTKALNGEAALGQLKIGWAAAYARDETLLATQLAQLPGEEGSTYRILPAALSSENIAIAMPKGDVEWQALVNDVIAQAARDKRLLGAYDTWFMKPIPGFSRALGIEMSPALAQEWDRLR